MPKASVSYIGSISHITHRRKEEVKFNSKFTVQDLLDSLIRKYGMRLRRVLYPKAGRFNENMVVLLNGKYIESLATSVENGDMVVICPVVSGG